QIVLVDPGYLNPKRRKVSLFTNMDVEIILKDMISDEVLSRSGESWEAEIPAGGFRILRAYFKN
ncbi:MAG: hypothetical protein PF450_01870, partial [Bacteroidales bacterium]|nr:hypothetical protein [Bacteroidales bacterium]